MARVDHARTPLPAILFALALAAVASPVTAVAAERAVVHMKDGSVLKGELLRDGAADCVLRTAFGELTLAREAIEAVYVERAAPAAQPDGAAADTPEKPAKPGKSEKPAKPGKSEKPAKPGKAGKPAKAGPAPSPRIREAEPEEDAAEDGAPASGSAGAPRDPAALLSMDDDELINLLSKSGKDMPPETVKPAGGGPPKAPVKKMYSYEGEKGNLLPPELTELELPPAEKGGKPAAGKSAGVSEKERTAGSLAEVDKALQELTGGKTAEVAAAPPAAAPPDAAAPPKSPADGAGTVEVRPFDPPKDSIDGKIHRQFKRHGALSAHPEDFRVLKGNEIEELLKKHGPAEGGTSEINIKRTDEVKSDGK